MTIPKLQVLVVENNEANLASAKQGLANAGAKDIRYASNSDDAVDIINLNGIDAVIVNENITGKDGCLCNDARWVRFLCDLKPRIIYFSLSPEPQKTLVRYNGTTTRLDYSLTEPEAWKDFYFMLLRRFIERNKLK